VPRSFHSKVVGVTHQNSDGSYRQAILRGSWEGRPLILKREPDNPYDSSAIAVFTEDLEQLGYIGAHLAESLAPQMDRGVAVSATISENTGGAGNKNTLGCNILITIDGDAESEEAIDLTPPKKQNVGVALIKAFAIMLALTIGIAVVFNLVK
jgi:single-stranded-DNA-specific exonuclease